MGRKVFTTSLGLYDEIILFLTYLIAGLVVRVI